MIIESRLQKLNNELPSNVKLVAVSKFQPNHKIISAYNAGQRVFAESRPQELALKVKELPSDIQWHFIGHLQTNKLKLVLPYVSLIHSVDSLRLLNSIQTWARENNMIISVLLEVHIAKEDTKQGFNTDELCDILNKRSVYPNILFNGLMAMASFTNDQSLITSEFEEVSKVFSDLQERFPSISEFQELSIGMSQDYHLAINAGSTMVRIGTYLFGDR